MHTVKIKSKGARQAPTQELRLLASNSREPAMLEAFRNNRDIHTETAIKIYKDDKIGKDDERRKKAKATNFLMAYGGSASKLAESLNIPRKEAEGIIKTYFEEYKHLKEYFDKVGNNARELGYVKQEDYIGRITWIRDFDKYREAKNHVEKFGKNSSKIVLDYYRKRSAEIQRMAQNNPIQGGSATISKLAGVLLYEKLKESNFQLFKIILLVHDEYVLECKSEDAEIVKTILEDCMLKASRFVSVNLDIPADAVIKDVWIK